MNARVLVRLAGCLLAVGLIVAPGCQDRPQAQSREGRGPALDVTSAAHHDVAPVSHRDAAAGSEGAEVPCADPSSPEAAPGANVPGKTAAVSSDDIPRYAANSPFAGDLEVPEVKEGKRLWADSLLWSKGPELVVETWLSEKPDTRGKYVLIEFWNTWCPPCRRSLALLNRLHEKYGKELVVIGVCDEKPETVRNFKTHKIAFYSAIDTQARTKKEFGVFGVPHAVIIEPEGYVIWEGFPLLKGYELTEDIIEKILAVGRKEKAKRPR